MDDVEIINQIKETLCAIERNRISIVENCSISVFDRENDKIFTKPYGKSISEISKYSFKTPDKNFKDTLHYKIHAELSDASVIISYYQYAAYEVAEQDKILEICSNLKESGVFFDKNLGQKTPVFAIDVRLTGALSKIFGASKNIKLPTKEERIINKNIRGVYQQALNERKKRIYGSSEYSKAKKLKNKKS